MQAWVSPLDHIIFTVQLPIIHTFVYIRIFYIYPINSQELHLRWLGRRGAQRQLSKHPHRAGRGCTGRQAAEGESALEFHAQCAEAAPLHHEQLIQVSGHHLKQARLCFLQMERSPLLIVFLCLCRCFFFIRIIGRTPRSNAHRSPSQNVRRQSHGGDSTSMRSNQSGMVSLSLSDSSKVNTSQALGAGSILGLDAFLLRDPVVPMKKYLVRVV